jgi:altronate hydrolase
VAQSVLHIHPSDNVMVALRDLKAGETVPTPDGDVTLREACAAKHKVLIRDLPAGGTVVQYGLTVGRTQSALARGVRVSTANTSHAADAVDASGAGAFRWNAPDVSKFVKRTFMGYERPDGRVGTRNQWLVIPLVFCENNNLMQLREIFNRALGLSRTAAYERYLNGLIQAHGWQDPAEKVPFESPQSPARLFPNVDGVRFLVHQMGCGGLDQDAQSLSELIASYIAHPNTAGATILSLGCQKAQIGMVEEALNKISPNHDRPLHYLDQQQSGTEETLMRAAIDKTFAGLVEADASRRKPFPLSKLTIGVKCGGSDGFSGISANPTVGRVSDLVVALGGSSILAEFPELFGAEADLVRRCVSPEIARRFIDFMRAYERDAQACGSSMCCNPSPGNVRDGLITDAMKSAGAAKKGGTSPVVDVLDYPGNLTRPGLNLLKTPGNDVEATTGIAGAGANLILFTTGLGTPTGNPVAPTMKISTNSRVAKHMHDVIDFDTGPIIDGLTTPDELGEALLEECIAVASGKWVKAEILLQDDFIPWKRGVSL